MPWLYTVEQGDCLGPASEQDLAAWKKAQDSGKPFLERGYHGFTLKVVVKDKSPKSTAT